ncbi:DUF6708 domain-containing protein [Citrobacter amalonaticus]|uniref:DUF6708 domain-containing protein n=1 Tax=Citrobacter amalonaticus TaxID=35703 RepID=UPI00300D1304
MRNIFKRLKLEPSRSCKWRFSTVNDKKILRRYVQGKYCSDVPVVSDLDNVIRLNSTYLELVDKGYYLRGGGTLFAGIVFSMMFVIGILWPLFQFLFLGGGKHAAWGVLITAWVLIFLPISWISYKFLISEVFSWTHYPIRFNRKNQMVYFFQDRDQVLAVPWKNLIFVAGNNSNNRGTWSIFCGVVADDGEKISHIFPLPAREWDTRLLGVFWEFIRCYMEEEECLADLAEAVAYCIPVEKQKEGWLFGLLYMARTSVGKLSLVVNIPAYPILLAISIPRWIVMQTSKIPVWPEEVAAACLVEPDDPVNIGAENNRPQLWRRLMAVEGKARYTHYFEKENAAMHRITARLKAKYGVKE